MSEFKRGDRVTVTVRRPEFDGLTAYSGQAATVGHGDREGRVVMFEDGFESYAFDDEMEAAP